MLAIAAVGHNQDCLALQEYQLVRTNTMRGKLADARETLRHVVDADDPNASIEVVFGGVQQSAIGREHPVPIEMPIGRRLERDCLGTAPKCDREGSWPSREGNAAP